MDSPYGHSWRLSFYFYVPPKFTSQFDIFFIAGEAEAILARSQATSKGIAVVSETLKQYGGLEVGGFVNVEIILL